MNQRAINRLRELAISQQFGIPFRIRDDDPTPEKAPMDINAKLTGDVAAFYRNRAEQAARRTAVDPYARANASVYRDCERAAASGYLPLIHGTRPVPGLPDTMFDIQRAAIQAGLTKMVSTDVEGWQ